MLVGPLISATGSNIKKAGIGIARWPVVGAARVIRTVLYPWVGRLSLLLSRSGVDRFAAMPWLYMPEPLPKTYVKATSPAHSLPRPSLWVKTYCKEKASTVGGLVGWSCLSF